MNSIPPFSLVFYRGEGFMSRAISRFSRHGRRPLKMVPAHVEIALPVEPVKEWAAGRFPGSGVLAWPDRVILLGSTRSANVPDFLTGKKRSGVQFFDPVPRIKAYRGRVWIRRAWFPGHWRIRDTTDYQTTIRLANEEYGKPYEWRRELFDWPGRLRLIGSVIDHPCLDWIFSSDDPSRRFCSELVVVALRLFGLDMMIKGGGYACKAFWSVPAEEVTPEDLFTASLFYYFSQEEVVK